MRIYLAGLILIVLCGIPPSMNAQTSIFAKGDCTVIYSLKRSADNYFNDEIAQLSQQINKKNVRFIDLNNWRKSPPHIEVSGRMRNQIRQQLNMPRNANQAVVLDNKGDVIQRYTGSVTLVNALIDCHY